MTTLLETIATVAIFALFLGAVSASFGGSKPYAVHAAVQSFGILLADARAVAQTSGVGATIVVAADAGNFTATLYPFRPFPGADMDGQPLRTIGGTVNVTPGAIFISSSATASAAQWSAGEGTLASEPRCADTIPLTFSNGMYAEPHAISCATAQLQ
jgi:type II secretory pathway pseudopilin PulG